MNSDRHLSHTRGVGQRGGTLLYGSGGRVRVVGRAFNCLGEKKTVASRSYPFNLAYDTAFFVFRNGLSTTLEVERCAYGRAV